MSTSTSLLTTQTSQYSNYQNKVAHSRATSEPVWVRWTLISIVLLFLTLFLIVPLAAVFTEALRKGFDTYITALTDPDALSSIKLTLITKGLQQTQSLTS